MSRLCFIGDSHLGCLKRAWDARSAEPGLETVFFALPGRAIGYLEVLYGALGSSLAEVSDYLKFTSSGLDRIDPSHDLYILHGMHLGIAQALELCRADQDRAVLRERIAAPEFRAALRAAIEDSTALVLLGKLRRITQAPVIVSPTPLAEARIPQWRSRLVGADAARPLAALFGALCDEVCRERGAAFLAQPPQTLAEDGIATAAEYSVDPARFRARERANDLSHMNAQYGAAVLAGVLQSAATSAAL